MKTRLILLAVVSLVVLNVFAQVNQTSDTTSKSRKAAFEKKPANNNSGIIRGKRFTQGSTFFWSYFDASKRASLISANQNGKLRVLAENPPDMAFSSVKNIVSALKLEVATVKVGAESRVELAKEVVQLGQRTAIVNILRDAMYRLNESFYNSQCTDCFKEYNSALNNNNAAALNAEQYTQLFIAILSITDSMSKNEALAKKYDAEIAKEKTKQMAIQDSINKLNVRIDSLKKAATEKPKEENPKEDKPKEEKPKQDSKAKKVEIVIPAEVKEKD